MADRAAKNHNKSKSECARELIDLGLKVEEAALHDNQNMGDAIDPVLLEILKNNMIWSLETRFLVRYLVEKTTETGSDSMTDLTKKAQERATNYVVKLIQNINSHVNESSITGN